MGINSCAALPLFGKEKPGKRRLKKVMLFHHLLMTGKLPFTVTQEEMAGPDN